MKRFFLAIVLIVMGVVMFAQPREFYGLKLGEKTNKQMIIDAVGENGIYNEESDSLSASLDNGMSFCSFTQGRYDEKDYSGLVFATSNNGELLMAAFIQKIDEERTPEQLQRMYEIAKVRLFKLYPSMSSNVEESEDGVKYTYLNNTEDGVGVLLQCNNENGQMSDFLIGYFDVDAVEEAVVPSMPTIQDTFFGMKIGSVQSSSNVKSALGSRGEFYKQYTEGTANVYEFINLYFGGRKWDFCEIMTNANNEFYYLYVYSSADWSFESDRVYKSLNETLSEKYGVGSESIEDHRSVTCYYGNNDMVVEVSNEKAQSKGGSLRYYVGLIYANIELSSKQDSLAIDEL